MIAIDHEGRRCDKRCHRATDSGARCKCVCDGKLHGSEHKPGGVVGQMQSSGVRRVQLNFLDVLNSPPAG